MTLKSLLTILLANSPCGRHCKLAIASVSFQWKKTGMISLAGERVLLHGTRASHTGTAPAGALGKWCIGAEIEVHFPPYYSSFTLSLAHSLQHLLTLCALAHSFACRSLMKKKMLFQFNHLLKSWWCFRGINAPSLNKLPLSTGSWLSEHVP